MSHQAPELATRSARLPPQLTQSICLRCTKRITNYNSRKVLPDGEIINKECFFLKGIDLSYAECIQKKKTCDTLLEVFHSAINRMLQLHCEWKAALAGSPEEAAVRRSLNGYQFNFTRRLEQNSVDKLASKAKLEDTSNEEDSSDTVPARSKSSKSFRASAKRANCKSIKDKTKGMRNIGDCIVKEEWIALSSIFKTKKIEEVRKLVLAKKKISESVEPFNDDDEDIEPIGGGKPSAPKKSKKEKTKTSVVVNIPSSLSKSFGILSTIPEPSVVLSAKRQETFVPLTKSSMPIMGKEVIGDGDLLNFSSFDIVSNILVVNEPVGSRLRTVDSSFFGTRIS
ncbi:hypothetical protein OCU04_007427 [Sclerotinia nivalis]|uniref:Uncharacterized protein n=1 Tax=Sclerotinia nivalis TaxID=352851 RepID=A0A9X0DIE1_9HELO|nr:hypothetical protein OCU04_007427 [Sclerotinia nivalis]